MKDKELLEICNKYLIYNPETGIVTNRINRGGAAICGEVTGSVTGNGYRRIRLNRKLYQAHRLVFLMYHGYMPIMIDHINHDKVDNRIANLRACTNAENQQNQKSFKNSSSRFKGVSWSKSDKKWRACISINGRNKSLGYFKDEEEAAISYNIEAKKHHGEFAYLNIIKG